MKMSVSIPGNILLFGEYALLNPGGFGVACAVDKKVKITVEPNRHLVIAGIMGNKNAVWEAAIPEKNRPDFIEHIVRVMDRYLCTSGKLSWGALDTCPVRITADSSDFFSSTGQKLGLGSSAAVTVGLVFAIFAAAHPDVLARPSAEIMPEILKLAIDAHRKIQGRNSSGYDITTSLYGGIGLFKIGLPPLWEKLSLPFPVSCALCSGDYPVSTPQAVGAYVAWKEKYPEKDSEFFRKSQALIGRFAHVMTWDECVKIVSDYRDLGCWIGREIAVEAEPPLLKSKISFLWGHGIPVKAVGAGGELAMALSCDPSNFNAAEKLYESSLFFAKTQISPEGLSWSAKE